jgi:enoyl-CoA hydratase/carnithine racemase
MDAAASWFLSRAVGISQALEWSLSGRLFGADEALAAGLVRSLHAADEPLAAAREVVHGMVARSAPVSVALNRQLIWRARTLQNPLCLASDIRD